MRFVGHRETIFCYHLTIGIQYLKSIFCGEIIGADFQFDITRQHIRNLYGTSFSAVTRIFVGDTIYFGHFTMKHVVGCVHSVSPQFPDWQYNCSGIQRGQITRPMPRLLHSSIVHPIGKFDGFDIRFPRVLYQNRWLRTHGIWFRKFIIRCGS